jgi:hypothetical protein
MTAVPATPHGAVQATEDKTRPVKLTNQQVGRAGEHFVAAEIHRRGGYAVMFTGNMPGIDMLASNRDNTHRVSIQVKTKGPNSGGWQTSTRHGLSSETADSALFAGRFWVLVDLRPANPGFYGCPNCGFAMTSTTGTGSISPGTAATGETTLRPSTT